MSIKKQLSLALPNESPLKGLAEMLKDWDHEWIRKLNSELWSPINETYHDMNSRLRGLTEWKQNNAKLWRCHCWNKLKKSKYWPENICYICIQKN